MSFFELFHELCRLNSGAEFTIMGSEKDHYSIDKNNLIVPDGYRIIENQKGKTLPFIIEKINN